MKINIVKIFTISAYFLAVSNLSAQQASNYDYKEAFKEPFIPITATSFVQQVVSQVLNTGKTMLTMF